MFINRRSLFRDAQSKRRSLLRCLYITVFVCIAGCVNIPSPHERLDNARQLALDAGWHQITIPTDYFLLTSFVPNKILKNKPLTVYIEGDGLAWITDDTVSPNPSPINPLALKLALQDPNQPVAYLARPCQFILADDARNCAATYWTDGRFSSEVIAATNQAINVLMQRFNSRQLTLVGYSGGGAVAALIAARRHDVVQLVTVAGNLDPRLWAEEHRVSPLSRSLDPADDWKSLVDIKQLHLVGANDTIVDKSIAQSFQSRFPADRRPEIKVIDKFDHSCCWSQHWRELVKYWQNSKSPAAH